jgi:hypothetical protein
MVISNVISYSICVARTTCIRKLTVEMGWSKKDDRKKPRHLPTHFFLCSPLFSLKDTPFSADTSTMVISNVISYWAHSIGPQFYVLNSILFPACVATPIFWHPSSPLRPFPPSPPSPPCKKYFLVCWLHLGLFLKIHSDKVV